MRCYWRVRHVLIVVSLALLRGFQPSCFARVSRPAMRSLLLVLVMSCVSYVEADEAKKKESEHEE